LIAGLAQEFEGNGAIVTLSPNNTEALALLNNYGFQQKRQLSHMRFGKELPRQRSHIYGQGSLSLG
jgi:hypothetical protein